MTGASNVTGEILPIRRLAALAHRYGARIAVDGAQLVPHRRISLRESGVDYLAFSGHKLYAPFGSGVLVGRAYLYGLMAGGEDGVRRVVEILAKEVRTSMQLVGARSVAELRDTQVRLRPA